jgi:hypothetical protein
MAAAFPVEKVVRLAKPASEEPDKISRTILKTQTSA